VDKIGRGPHYDRIKPIAWWPAAGNARRHIASFQVNPGDRFVLLCRVSSHQQGRRGNLVAQETNLREAVESHGGIVVAVKAYEWSGKGPKWFEYLNEAALSAQRHDAILLAATTDRFIRSEWYRSDSERFWRAQAQHHELYDLRDCTRGVPLMTYLDPNTPPGECRALLTQWGQAAKGKGGRPRKADREPGYAKRRRETYTPMALQRRAQGGSWRAIAAEVSRDDGAPVTHVTISKWVKRRPVGC
jgi:hypothetical protein